MSRDADARNLLNIGMQMQQNDRNEDYRNKQLGIQQEQLQMQRQKNAREKAIYDYNQAEIAGVEKISEQMRAAEANGEEFRFQEGMNTRHYGKALKQYMETTTDKTKIAQMNNETMKSAHTRALMIAPQLINNAAEMAWDRGDWKGAATSLESAFDDLTPMKVDLAPQEDGSVLISYLDAYGNKSQPVRAQSWRHAYMELNKDMIENVGINSDGSINEKIFAQFNAKNIAAAKMYNRKQMEGDTKFLTNKDSSKKPIPYRVLINPINMSRDLVSVETGKVLNKDLLTSQGYGTREEINAMLQPEKVKSELQKLKETAQGASSKEVMRRQLTGKVIDMYKEKFGDSMMGEGAPDPQTDEQKAFLQNWVNVVNRMVDGGQILKNGHVKLPETIDDGLIATHKNAFQAKGIITQTKKQPKPSEKELSEITKQWRAAGKSKEDLFKYLSDNYEGM